MGCLFDFPQEFDVIPSNLQEYKHWQKNRQGDLPSATLMSDLTFAVAKLRAFRHPERRLNIDPSLNRQETVDALRESQDMDALLRFAATCDQKDWSLYFAVFSPDTVSLVGY